MMDDLDRDGLAKGVLDFWFGPLVDGWAQGEERAALWFGARPEDDRLLRERFLSLVNLAVEGRLGHWVAGEEGGGGDAASEMALVILVDQITRAVFRGEAKAFSGDEVALAVCQAGVNDGRHLALPPAWRRFYYLPLEHSECLAHQELCVRLYEAMRDELKGEGGEAGRMAALEENVKYAVLHRDIVAEFGRFPHRNAVLGRESTPAEARFLVEKNLHFGQ